jgi:hypothetical protein
MEDGTMQRAQQRVSDRAEAVALETLAVRAREQVEALAAATSALEESLPSRIGEALREQAQPVGRRLAEVRGLMNGVSRRLGQVEGDLLLERHARVDDLALLVDLISLGWQNVDARLARMEAAIDRVAQLEESSEAIVYRMEDRRPESATS